MMAFTGHPDHNRLIEVKFDTFVPYQATEMTIRVRYIEDGQMSHSKALRLDNEIMPLLKAAPALLAAVEALFKHCAMIHKYGGEIDNTREAAAAIAAAHAAIASARGKPLGTPTQEAT